VKQQIKSSKCKSDITLHGVPKHIYFYKRRCMNDKGTKHMYTVWLWISRNDIIARLDRN